MRVALFAVVDGIRSELVLCASLVLLKAKCVQSKIMHIYLVQNLTFQCFIKTAGDLHRRRFS